MNGEWRFTWDDETFRLVAPEGLEYAAEALQELVESDIGGDPRIVRFYISTWESIDAGREDGRSGMSGNSTAQYLQGDQILLESQYELWPSVRMPKQEFFEFLQQYLAFADSRH